MTTDPIALLRDAENYLSALHGSVARHDHLAANLACAGCELRDRIAAALPELAAVSSAVVAPRTDQTTAEAALAAVETALGDTLTADVARIAAVLPAPADRAAVLREAAADVVSYCPDHGDRDTARITCHCEIADELRRAAADAQPEPGARHVHITIHHPDPTTAHTAALCIADLVRGEYGDSLTLAITTDAQDTGGSPRRLADETPDTTADTFAGGSYLTAEHDTLGMIAARHGGDRLAWEMANPWVTSSAMVLPAGLRVAIPAQAGPAAGARQDGAQQ